MEDELSLEEELLQVAGRSRLSGKKRVRARADSDEDGQVEADSDADVGFSGRRGAGPSRRARSEDEADDSDADTDYGDGYDSDLMGDEEDRAELMAMNELEREMILADRSEARDREREKRSTAALLKQRQRETDQAAQMRSSTRMKSNDSAKKTAMAELVAAQARRRKSKSSKNKRRKDQDEEAWSDEDEEELSGSEYAVSDKSSLPKSDQPEEDDDDDDARDGLDDDRGRPGSPSRYLSDEDEIQRFPEPEEADEADFSDVQRIQLFRRQLAKWLNRPFFERTLPGCMVRLAVKGAYMLAEVETVVEMEPGPHKCPGVTVNSPYMLEEKVETSKWIQVVRGLSRQTMPLTLVSNQPFTEEEWEAWQKQCKKDNRPQLTRKEVKDVTKKLSDAHTYVYTHDDVKRIIDEKRAKGSVRNVALEKARLLQHLEAAKAKGDVEEEARLSFLISEIESKAKQRDQTSRLYGMAHINARNKQRNFENALHNVGARPEGVGGPANAKGIDPFSRRKTRPTVMWSTKKHQSGLAIATGTEAATADGADEQEPDTPLAIATAIENAAGGIDLDIDVSILNPLPPEALLAKRLLGARWQQALSPLAVPADLASKKVLTLTDYKYRQGIS